MTIALPEKDEIERILGIFMQNSPELLETAPVDLSSPTPGSYYTLMANESGEVVGAMVADITATVYIGGSLVMIPQNSQIEQIENVDPNEAVIDGISEAFNAIRGAVNRIGDNPHVNYTPVTALESPETSDRTSWMVEPSLRMDLVGEFPVGEGRLVLLAR